MDICRLLHSFEHAAERLDKLLGPRPLSPQFWECRAHAQLRAGHVRSTSKNAFFCEHTTMLK